MFYSPNVATLSKIGWIFRKRKGTQSSQLKTVLNLTLKLLQYSELQQTFLVSFYYIFLLFHLLSRNKRYWSQSLQSRFQKKTHKSRDWGVKTWRTKQGGTDQIVSTINRGTSEPFETSRGGKDQWWCCHKNSPGFHQWWSSRNWRQRQRELDL